MKEVELPEWLKEMFLEDIEEDMDLLSGSDYEIEYYEDGFSDESDEQE